MEYLFEIMFQLIRGTFCSKQSSDGKYMLDSIIASRDYDKKIAKNF